MKELTVISKSKRLVSRVYEIARALPKSEQYVLIPQMLRSVISIPSNLAEGQQRTDKEFIRFINIARGSLFELKVQLEIVLDQYGLNIHEAFEDIDEIGKMTYGLLLKLRSDKQ